MNVDKGNAVPIEKLYEKIGSMYKLVIIAAKRALELSDGSPRLVEAPAKQKPSLVALKEILEGKVGLRIKKKSKE